MSTKVKVMSDIDDELIADCDDVWTCKILIRVYWSLDENEIRSSKMCVKYTSW